MQRWCGLLTPLLSHRAALVELRGCAPPLADRVSRVAQTRCGGFPSARPRRRRSWAGAPRRTGRASARSGLWADLGVASTSSATSCRAHSQDRARVQACPAMLGAEHPKDPARPGHPCSTQKHLTFKNAIMQLKPPKRPGQVRAETWKLGRGQARQDVKEATGEGPAGHPPGSLSQNQDADETPSGTCAALHPLAGPRQVPDGTRASSRGRRQPARPTTLQNSRKLFQFVAFYSVQYLNFETLIKPPSSHKGRVCHPPGTSR